MKVILILSTFFCTLFSWAQIDLKPIAKDKICMQLNEAYPTKQKKIKLDGHTYSYCCDHCKRKLSEEPELRVSKDPLSGKEIDKSLSFPAKDSQGKVVYFENEKNFKLYLEKAAEKNQQ